MSSFVRFSADSSESAFLIQKKRLSVAGESLSFHRKRFNVFAIPFYSDSLSSACNSRTF